MKEQKHTVTLLHQEGIDLSILSSKVPQYVYRQAIDYILLKQYYAQYNDTNPELKNVFVPVSRKEIRNIHWKGDFALRQMHDNNILLRTNYVVGEKAYDYKFTSRAFGQLNTHQIRRGDIHHNAFSSLTSRLCAQKYEVSKDEDYIKQLAFYSMSISLDDEAIDVATQNNSKHLRPLVNILNNKWSFKSNTDDGRVYTNFSSLSKHYTKYVRLGDYSDLSQVDISNSNYYFLCVLYLSHYMRKGYLGGSVTRSNTNTHSLTHTLHYMRKGNTKTFINMCLSGDIYEELMKVADPHYKVTVTRDMAKKIAQIILNKSTDELLADTYQKTVGQGDDRYDIDVSNSRMKAIYQDLRTRYIEVFEWMEDMKEQLTIPFGVRLMQMESDIMIHRVAKRLVQETMIPVLTKHDCIVAPTNFIDDVYLLMKEEFEKEYGLLPSMTTEKL